MKNKRDLLKGLAVSPVWAAPVVQALVLPAHANTSGCAGALTGPTQSLSTSCLDDDFEEEVCYTICEPFSGTSGSNFVVIPCESFSESDDIPTQLLTRAEKFPTNTIDQLNIALIGPETSCGNLGSQAVQFDCEFTDDSNGDMQTGLRDSQGNCYRIDGTYTYIADPGILTLSALTATRL